MYLLTLFHTTLSLKSAYVAFVVGQLPPPNKGFKSPCMYLSSLNVILQAAYFGLAACADVMGTEALLGHLRDLVFASAVFPVGMCVCTAFWAMCAVDPKLLFGATDGASLPVWLLHSSHTNIFLYILMEACFVHHSYPEKWLGLAMCSAVLLLYCVWVVVIYRHTGFWVYAFLRNMGWLDRIMYGGAGLILYGATLYTAGENLNALLWTYDENVINVM